MEKPTTESYKDKRVGITLLDIILFFFIGLAAYILLSFFLTMVFRSFAGETENAILLLMLNEILMLVCVLGAALAVLGIRKIPLSHLGLSFRWKDAITGFVLALVLYVVGFGISLSLGAVEILLVAGNASSLLATLTFFFIVALTEELMIRGFILGHLIDGGLNCWAALYLSSLIFSSMHLLNPDFSFLPFLNIFLAGVILGIPYLYTRNLSLPIALHWFWNWFQGPVLGFKVSGVGITDSLLTLNMPEENLINGGRFGFENSLVCTFLLIAGCLYLMYKFRKNQVLENAYMHHQNWK